MTPLPKRRHSSARQSKRTRALKLSHIKLVECNHCQKLILQHRVCKFCGYYRNSQVIHKIIKKNTEKKIRQ